MNNLEIKHSLEIQDKTILITEHMINPSKNLIDTIVQYRIDTNNKLVKDALIKLGWKPPSIIKLHRIENVKCNIECGARTCYPLCGSHDCEYLKEEE